MRSSNPVSPWRRALAVGALIAAVLALIFALRGTGAAVAQEAEEQKIPGATYAETEAVGPGVRHTEFDLATPEGKVVGDLLEVNLKNKNVSADLIYPGTVAARDEVSDLAEKGDAVAAVNGDFFNIGQTGAPEGPAIADRADLKGSLADQTAVFGVGADGLARMDELALEGEVSTPDGAFGLDGLNQFVIEKGGIGAFNRIWGSASRDRATCSASHSVAEPCSGQTFEVVVKDGVVTEKRAEPGSGEIPAGTSVLVGREEGAALLERELQVGERVDLGYRLVPLRGGPLEFAIGGGPHLVRDGQRPGGLDSAYLAPRTAVGNSADGTRMYLLTVDGRSAQSRGMHLEELAGLMQDIGADDAFNLDGGGSSTLIAEEPGEDDPTVQNAPSSGGIERPVPNGIGLFAGDGPRRP